MENELRLKRKKLGLTQAQMAKACGVSRRTYQTYEETGIQNTTYKTLLQQLQEFGYDDEENSVLSIRKIKSVCDEIFRKYEGVECAYLYGSYARGEATRKSDVDILVVCHGMGLSFFTMAVELEDSLHKKVDLQTHEQVGDNADFLENILVEGIKLYDKKNNPKNKYYYQTRGSR